MQTIFLWPGGPVVYDNDSAFSIGTDAVALGVFAGRASGRAADLGCGSGVIGLSLAWRNEKLRVDCVDIQPAAADAAAANIELNGLAGRMSARCADLRQMVTPDTADSYDLVVANPPYYPAGSGKVSQDQARAIARTEICCTLTDVCKCAAGLLKTGGRLCIVHKPERLAELMYGMHSVGIEPKRLRYVQAAYDAAPSLVLVEGKRGARPGLVIEPPYIPGREPLN